MWSMTKSATRTFNNYFYVFTKIKIPLLIGVPLIVILLALLLRLVSSPTD